MNGPEHYDEAERLLHRAGTEGGMPAHQHAALVSTAQVHATLALAAATAAERSVGPQESWGGHTISVVPNPPPPWES